jgi:curli biogenesis system outer membrane secretion channel CsgG
MHRAIVLSAIAALLGGCAAGGVQVGSDRARTPATGSAAGATSTNAYSQLERCDQTLGTLAVEEDERAPWFHRLRNEYQLQSTVPLLRMMIQQSNCFVVVERGRAMNNMARERQLERSGELRQGSNFGQGQVVAADYTMRPEITFTTNDAGGIGGGISAATRRLGGLGAVAGSVAGNIKFREAATSLLLIDNRSSVQLAASEGAASKTDFGAWGGLFGSGAAGNLGGYTRTPEGKLIAGAFADAYNQMVVSVKNYRAQEVRGGMGTGGQLGVQGGSTPASRQIGR